MRSFKWAKARYYFWAAVEGTITPRLRFNTNLMNASRIFFTRRILKVLGITDIKVIGELSPDTNLIAANHQSSGDIFVLEAVIGNELRFIGRTGIMDKWPISAMVDLLGHITVDQKDRRAIIHLLSEVKSKIPHHQVCIFPEGTRSQTGKIEKFEGGTKVLAEKLKLKVQPCVIRGILDCYDENKKTSNNSAIELEFLPPVVLEEGWYEKMHDDMQKVYLKN